MADEPYKCPHCAGILNPEMVAKFSRRSLLTWKLHPAPGELLDIGTVGGTLTQMRNMLRASGEGIPTEVLLKSAFTDEAGAFTAEFLVCRYEEATDRRKRFAKRKKETA